MAKQSFKRLDNGYGCRPDFVGFGYYISCDYIAGEHSVYVYNFEDVTRDEDGYTSCDKDEVKVFDRINDAKAWCRENAR